MIEEVWRIQSIGNPLFRLITKLKNVKLGLKKWVMENADPHRLTQGKVDSLRLVEKALESDPSDMDKQTQSHQALEGITGTFWGY